ncbi:hypothetical protein [Clostridium tyrobutyricum]|uniref:hypothetical protein n=1 Tax=Clostridium tyrobutyricum TaxID=1519 RepID=UPI002B1F5AC1|nr:hypothetical protein [Clostridium tyrobutyricum]MEA5008752.1 hypothetical protein [Clostridium tyrobutyricum]
MFYYIENYEMKNYGEIMQIPDDIEKTTYVNVYDCIAFENEENFNVLNYISWEDSPDRRDYCIDADDFEEYYLIVYLDDLSEKTRNILYKLNNEIDYEDLTEEEVKEVKQDLLQNKCTNIDKFYEEGTQLDNDLWINCADYNDLIELSKEDEEQLENMEQIGEVSYGIWGECYLFKTKNGDLYFNKYSNCEGDLLFKYDIYKKVKNYKDAGVSKEEWNEMLEG